MLIFWIGYGGITESGWIIIGNEGNDGKGKAGDMCLFREGIAEGGDKFAFRRPVGDGEDNVGEDAAEVGIEGFAEIGGGAHGIIAKRTATPRAKHQGFITECPGDCEHPENALLQEVCGKRLADPRGNGSGTSDEVKVPWGLQRRAGVDTKHGHAGREDGPSGRFVVGPFLVSRIHGVARKCLIERAGAAKHFLLSAGPAEKAAARSHTIGEVQCKWAQAPINEPP